jgi:hypothetical protein
MTRYLGVQSKVIAIGFVLGGSYGLVSRAVAELRESWIFGVMTLGFLFVVPIVIGYLTVYPQERPSLPFAIFGPWVPSLATVLAAALLGWEGSICIVLASPVLLGFASLGGLIGKYAPPSSRRVALPLLLIAPYVIAPLEKGHTAPTRTSLSETEILIHAPAWVVWPLVVSVDSIRPSEERPALFTAMGFPHPINAVIDHPGVGGIRTARFTGGLVFTERVTTWEDKRRISFTIRPNTDSIPTTTLDPHVTIGGPYFDVLTGTYDVYVIDGNTTRLVLRSEHRVSTPFNPYAGWWSNRIMKSIQQNILEIIRARAELASRTRQPA